MNRSSPIATDLVLSPFGASATELVEAAKCADESGFDGIWVLDHFSGKLVGKGWSHEPFTVLGAIANSTKKVSVGPLVANMINRNPVLLASSFSSLQSLAAGRAVLGLGTGAPPGSKFALEQEMIGRRLEEKGVSRRERLIETINALRSIWNGDTNFEGNHFSYEDLESVIMPNTPLRIIVGANGRKMIELASNHADGVNIRVGPSIKELIHLATELAPSADFEISIHEDFDYSHPFGGDFEKWVQMGVTKRACMVNAPFDMEAISAIGARIVEATS
ncbi:MAG: LLM class flavin-dependent oxidoreductase [Acidimicrobiales bacterium]|jgi:alkanesulfonate monooxygenase SsuD/methylene tetrahydromethanopterin reductase-like flavin-dependent oxidoreductase (luciferase family)|nr:LLM class flavin-dependent oxidoreductase [Acidimicrobiales bacterium]|tara:strand:- start:1769 stop:2599 length:831 start_codon:yes stop_codon:yes gene_type:complete